MGAEVTFRIEAPADCTQQQFEEWIKFRLQERRNLSADNPLKDYELDLAANGEIDFINIETL